LLPILAAATGLSERDVMNIVSTAPSRYKVYAIPKRNGDARIVSQPAREVKVLQRIIVTEILEKLPIHPSAKAYRKGVSITDNARSHAGDGPILKFDFKNFFPSIVAQDWRAYCERMSVFDDFEDVQISALLLFRRTEAARSLRLAIGAPSSPCLSNILLYEFDNAICAAMQSEQVRYTRYADDLTFSARRTGFLNHVEEKIRRVIRAIKSPSLELNEEKTVMATRKYKRVVTGLVLTNDGSVSVGHERKRAVRAGLHHAMLNRLSATQLAALSGSLAFIQSVEPGFVSRMEARYGSNLMERVKAAPRLIEDLDESYED
jgi:hypothetical protein